MTAPRLREATFDDYEGIAALETACDLRAKPAAEWMDLWVRNPVYRRLEQWPIGWVLEDGGGRIVGFVGNVPLLYHLCGRELLAAAGRAWVVDPRYRTYSLLLMATYFDQPAVDLFLNTTVNAQATAAFSAFESERPPVGQWDRSGFWVTHARGFAESALRLKGIPLPGLLSYPAGVALAIRRSLPPTAEQTSIDECGAFDERFSAFWDRLLRERRGTLLGNRCRETLAWHFHHALARREAWIATVRDGSGLLAYAVFVRRDQPDIGLTRMRLADCQSLAPRRPLLPVFLAWALRKCRAERLHALEVIGGGVSTPYRRALPAWCYYYKAAAADVAEALRQPLAWDPSVFDGDATL